MQAFIITAPDVGGYMFECDGSADAIASEIRQFIAWAKSPVVGRVCVQRMTDYSIVARF